MNIEVSELSKYDNHTEYCELLQQLTSIDPASITREMFDNHLEMIQKNQHHKILVARLDGKLVGTITLLIEPKFIHNLSKVGHIEDVVVNSAYRTHGIGSILVKYAIQVGLENGCYKIILDCTEKNGEFYKKFGFVKKEMQMALYLN